MFIYSFATDHLQKSKETLLKNLFICTSKFLIIIKNLKTFVNTMCTKQQYNNIKMNHNKISY